MIALTAPYFLALAQDEVGTHRLHAWGMEHALELAWLLNRAHNQDVVIVDAATGQPLAAVKVEWQ